MGAIILGIALFMFLVLIHELGHFLTAKRSGVKVLEFGIGIPPKVGTLWRDKQGTEYTINWIPLGGFVRLKGENPDDTEDFLAPDSFITASLPHKLLVLFAGVIVNALFAWFAFSMAFQQGVYPINVIPDNMIKGESESYLMPTVSFLDRQGYLSGEERAGPVVIDKVLDDSLASEVGLTPGDEVVRVAGQPVDAMNLPDLLKGQIGEEFSLNYLRDDDEQVATVVCPDDQCMLGIILEGDGRSLKEKIQFDGFLARKMGAHELRAQTKLTFAILGSLGRSLFSFDQQQIGDSVNRLSGPVGIVKFGETVLDDGGWLLYLAFGGMISLALAIFNVLPIPALDGGRALGVIVQTVGRFKPENYFVIENYLNIFFFGLLMLLGVYIILLDLVRFWDVSIPFIGG